MNFTKLASLFKDCHRISVVKYEGDLWIGNGIAQYRIEGNIETDDEGLYSLLNIPSAKREVFEISRNAENVINMLHAAVNNDSVETYHLPLGFTPGGKKVRIYATEFGAVIFNQKLIDIAPGEETIDHIFMCGKIPVLGLWNDRLQAVICPMQTLTEKSLTMLERFAAQVRLARENKILLPREPEQVEFDDYPF